MSLILMILMTLLQVCFKGTHFIAFIKSQYQRHKRRYDHEKKGMLQYCLINDMIMVNFCII